MLCCAFARRTMIKKPIVLHGIGQINGYYIFKNTGNGVHMNDFVVSLIQAWLQMGKNYLVNFQMTPVVEKTAALLDQQWKDKTPDQCEWDIIECLEKVKMKKPRTARDEFVAVMGRDILKRKKSMQVIISSYKVLADDENIISLNDFISLDSVVCRSFDVITGETITFPVQDWFKEKHSREYATPTWGRRSLRSP